MDCILGTQVRPLKQPTSNVGKSGEDISTSVPKKVPIAASKKRKSTKTEKQQNNDGFARCVIDVNDASPGFTVWTETVPGQATN